MNLLVLPPYAYIPAAVTDWVHSNKLIILIMAVNVNFLALYAIKLLWKCTFPAHITLIIFLSYFSRKARGDFENFN